MIQRAERSEFEELYEFLILLRHILRMLFPKVHVASHFTDLPLSRDHADATINSCENIQSIESCGCR